MDYSKSKHYQNYLLKLIALFVGVLITQTKPKSY